MKDVIKLVLGSLVLGIVVTFISALIAGAFLCWGNDFALSRSIYEHFGIAGLSYGQYVSGSWILGIICKLTFQSKAEVKVKK